VSAHGRLGRPPKGVDHVDSVSGSEDAKERLRSVLLALTGELTRAEAAARIGVSERRLRELRDRALASAVESLEPGRPGRPPKARPSAEAERAARLEEESEMLAFELEVSRTREELALLMPHLVRSETGSSPGGPGKAQASGSGRPRGAARRSTRRG